MNNFNINTLYKFQKLPFKSEFFNETYSLIGRSGKSGAIDQLLEIYPNCVAGISAEGEEDGKMHLEIYIIYYRFRKGKVKGNDVVFNCFGVAGNHIYTSDDPSAIFLDENNPELYFLNGKVPSFITDADLASLEEQRILFNTRLEKCETIELNVDEFDWVNDVKLLDFIEINNPIHPEGLVKLKSLTAIH
jgi:hypothetical protein